LKTVPKNVRTRHDASGSCGRSDGTRNGWLRLTVGWPEASRGDLGGNKIPDGRPTVDWDTRGAVVALALQFAHFGLAGRAGVVLIELSNDRRGT
jgi:hypothetical protein